MRCNQTRPAYYFIGAVIIAAILILTGVSAFHAQESERFRGRLSILPVDFASLPNMSGSGVVTAELRESLLTIEVAFEGLSTPATGATIRNAARGRRGSVVLAVEIGTATDTTGRFSQIITLESAEIAELRQERYYLQIQTERNPDGEIRGWLLSAP